MKEEVIDNDETSNIGNEIIEEDRTIEDLKKDYPNGIENLEEVLLIYLGENDPKNLKTEFQDKWKYFTKNLAYPYEYFNSIVIIKNLLII